MNIVLMLIGFLTILGIGYLCIDSYHHRQRTISQLPSTDTGSDGVYHSVELLEINDLHAAEQTLTQVGHTIQETTHQAITHSVEAIAHTLSHYCYRVHTSLPRLDLRIL